MARWNSGYATIDHTMQIKKADEHFYNYVGENSFYSLSQSAHPDDLRRLKVSIENLNNTGNDFITYRMKRHDGKYRWFLAKLEYEPIEFEGEYLISVSFQDLLEWETEVQELKEHNRRNEEYLSLMDGILFLYLIEEKVLKISLGVGKNEAVLFRGTLDEWIEGIKERHTVEEESLADFDMVCENIRNGERLFQQEIVSTEFSVEHSKEKYLIKGKTLMNSSRERYVVGCISQISSDSGRTALSKNFEDNIDSTTGLLNKKAIIDYARNHIVKNPDKLFSLCIVDLDNFKEVNDTYGHMFGDEVLAKVAGLIKEGVGTHGVAGRIGGDEMMFILEDIGREPSELRTILRTIRSSIEWNFKGKLGNISLTSSLGLAAYPDDASDYESLFKIADKMLYRAKQKGKNRYVIYTREVHGDVLGEEQPEAQYITSAGQDKEAIVIKLMGMLRRKKVVSYEVALQDILVTFGLDEVNFFYDYDDNTQWRMIAGNVPLEEHCKRNFDFVTKDNFEELFNEKGLAVLDNVQAIAGKYVEAHRYFSELGVRTALVYRIWTNGHNGYLVFMRKSLSSRKWEEKDKNYLTFIGELFTLTINSECR